MKKLDNIPTETLSMNFFCNSCNYDSFSICIKSMYHADKPKGNNWFFFGSKWSSFLHIIFHSVSSRGNGDQHFIIGNLFGNKGRQKATKKILSFECRYTFVKTDININIIVACMLLIVSQNSQAIENILPL